MDLPLARRAAPGLRTVEAIGSTNAELAARERRGAQPHGTALATLDQTAGRGRLDRAWTAPPGASLAVSIVLAGGLPPAALPWLPLLGGLAAAEAVDGLLSERAVAVKWPNDVLVTGADGRERKIAGVLAELVGETGAVVLGVGVNTAMRAEQLPVPTATSIAVELGRDGDPVDLADAVAAALLTGVLARVGALAAADGDAVASGLAAELARRCGTIGRRVRVELPGAPALVGVATGVDGDGALILSDENGGATAVRAGDVTHLRYEEPMTGTAR